MDRHGTHSGDSFIVFHWNILADYLSEDFPHSDPNILKWEYRAPRILNIIKESNADLISLVEVDHYSDFIEPELSVLGYKSLFQKKKGNNLDGCVLAWKNSFVLESYEILEYLEDNSQIAIIAFFNFNGKGLCVVTTHLKAKVGFEDIRAREISILLEKLKAVNTKNYPIIVCGDMNDVPDSVMATLFFNNQFLSGCYLHKWTTWKKRKEIVKRTIDYILHTQGSIPIAQLDVPSDEDCPKYLPALYYPSDHLSISVKFVF